MASALCVLLCELLYAASAVPRLPALTRAHVYQSTHAMLFAFALPAAEALAPALLKSAWMEFSRAGEAAGADGSTLAAATLTGRSPALPSQTAGGKQGSKKRRRTAQGGAAKVGTAVDADGAAASVEHSHRPANAQHVMTCQVQDPPMHRCELRPARHDRTGARLVC